MSYTVRTAADLAILSGGHSSLAAAEHDLAQDAINAVVNAVAGTRHGLLELVITRDETRERGPVVAIHLFYDEQPS